MKNRYVKIIMISVVIAVIVVVVFKLLGQENPTVFAGGIVGALVGGFSKKRNPYVKSMKVLKIYCRTHQN